MSLRRFRRSTQRRFIRAAILVIFILGLWDFLTLLKNFHTFADNLRARTYTDISNLPSLVKNQKVFITAQHWTSEFALRDFWTDNLVELINVLGKENVFVSVLGSGGLDDTGAAITDLESKLSALGVRRDVLYDPTNHADAIAAGPLDTNGNLKSGWIKPKADSEIEELRRIPFLAGFRNQGLVPLQKERLEGRTYDKILFLNDVVFNPSDVLSLLATNQGSYAAACALDFNHPPAYYDTFALRDSSGFGTVMSQFPYFGRSESLRAMLQGKSTRVQSCWNGMVFMDANPFYDDTASNQTGLQFRGVADSLATHHIEGSECCLIYADLVASGMAGRGIYVNPAVRVGYNRPAYEAMHTGLDHGFLNATQYVAGVWYNRLTRLRRAPISIFKPDIVGIKLAQWHNDGLQLQETRREPGEMCLIDEMHMVIWNGWKHVW